MRGGIVKIILAVLIFISIGVAAYGAIIRSAVIRNAVVEKICDTALRGADGQYIKGYDGEYICLQQ